MTVIKGNEGGVPTLDNVDLTHAKTMVFDYIRCKMLEIKGL